MRINATPALWPTDGRWELKNKNEGIAVITTL
jgi:hypothetical protein